MYFTDRCYTETRNSEQVYIHDSFNNHRKDFPGTKYNVPLNTCCTDRFERPSPLNTIRCGGGNRVCATNDGWIWTSKGIECSTSDDSNWSSGSDCTKFNWETDCDPYSSDEHRFIEIDSEQNSRKFERAHHSRRNTSSNSMSNVAFKYNKDRDNYTFYLKWCDSKPESVKTAIDNGKVRVCAQGKTTSTPLYVYKCERQDTEKFERNWEVPEDADPHSLEYNYDDELGIVKVHLKRKKHLFGRPRSYFC